MNSVSLGGTFKTAPSWDDLREAQELCGLSFWRLTVIGGELKLELSDSFLELIGGRAEEVPGRLEDFIGDFVHADDQAELLAMFAECLHHPEAELGFDHRLRNQQTGRWRWFRAFGRGRRFDQRGQAEEIFGCTLDINEFYTALAELRKAHSSLHHERDRVSAIIDAADIMVWDWDLLTWERIYGVFPPPGPSAESPGSVQEAWGHLLSPKDRERAQESARRHARGETPLYEEEYHLIRPDGTSLWVQERGRVVERGPDGQPLRLMGIILDITRQKKAEKDLREKNDQMELIIKTARIGTWDWDVVRNWLSFNPTYCRMLGYEEGELDGSLEKWRSFVHPEDLTQLNRHFSEIFVGPGQSSEGVIRMRHKEGHYVPTRGIGRIVDHGDEGQALRIVGVQIPLSQGIKS